MPLIVTISREGRPVTCTVSGQEANLLEATRVAVADLDEAKSVVVVVACAEPGALDDTTLHHYLRGFVGDPRQVHVEFPNGDTIDVETVTWWRLAVTDLGRDFVTSDTAEILAAWNQREMRNRA